MSISKRIILTGAPGTGKTTLLHAVRGKGYQIFSEVARELISGGKIPPVWNKGKDDTAFGDLVLNERIKQFRKAKKNEYHFYDRGIPDALVFSQLMKKQPSDQLKQAINEYRYSKKVFVLPPWKEIYHSDAVRKESFEQVLEIHDYTIEQYEKAGYSCVILPKCSVQERLKIIFLNLQTSSEPKL